MTAARSHPSPNGSARDVLRVALMSGAVWCHVLTNAGKKSRAADEFVRPAVVAATAGLRARWLFSLRSLDALNLPLRISRACAHACSSGRRDTIA